MERYNLEKESFKNFEVRCPHCRKLYSTAFQNVFSEEPHFECIDCKSEFSVQIPQSPTELTELTARLISVGGSVLQKECPKCGALNSGEEKECKQCLVIFEKLLGLDENKQFGATPSLIAQWRAVLDHYDQENFHNDFINSCKAESALAFALTKYQTLEQSIGGDETCQKYIKVVQAQLQVRLQGQIHDPKTEIPRVGINEESPKVSDKAPHDVQTSLLMTTENLQDSRVSESLSAKDFWKWMDYSPILFGGILLLSGFAKGGNKNAIGLGVALLIVGFGMLTMNGSNKK